MHFCNYHLLDQSYIPLLLQFLLNHLLHLVFLIQEIVDKYNLAPEYVKEMDDETWV